MKNTLLLVVGFCSAASAHGSLYVTEWMYQGKGTDPNNSLNTSFPEFIEVTNVGSSPLDLSGWSYDDNTEVAGSMSLTPLGILQPGEAAIITEDLPAHFRTIWNLSPSVKILGGSVENLGRSDEINLYDDHAALVDRLTYNDQGAGNVKGPRTNGTSAWTLPVNLGLNKAVTWTLSVVSDAQGSWTSSQGEVGNPGVYIPEPATLSLLAIGCLVVLPARHTARL